VQKRLTAVNSVDWMLLGLLVILVLIGLGSIYTVTHDISFNYNTSTNFSKQCLWALLAFFIGVLILFTGTRFYKVLAHVLYFVVLLILLSTLVLGTDVKGHNAWIKFGSVYLQPTEFAKLASSLSIAKLFDDDLIKSVSFKTRFLLILVIALPVLFTLLQKDLGSSLVFCSFIVVFYREHIFTKCILISLFICIISIIALFVPHDYILIAVVSITLLIICLLKGSVKGTIVALFISIVTLILVELVDLFVDNVLKPHQQNRIKALINPNIDPKGIGWNVVQSKIAIGSGGLWGKGFLKGTQTQYKFVPKQHTDFVFCAIGEEYGWIGCFLVISLFLFFILRIIYIAERQRIRFARVYAYAVASILFFHFVINVGMTIGLMPVIGIPLPFISYGGSSLLTFISMIFILLKLDSERKEYIYREV